MRPTTTPKKLQRSMLLSKLLPPLMCLLVSMPVLAQVIALQPPLDDDPQRTMPRYFQAVVIESQAVMAAPERGCWIEAGAVAGDFIVNVSQRCIDPQAQADPHCWSVLYSFRGRQYRVQMSSDPGPTITVDRDGVPRG